MDHRAIRKPPERLGAVPPNLADYASECARFDWRRAERELDFLPGGRGLNIAHEAVDRHAQGARSSKPALRWHPLEGAPQVLSYADVREATSRFASGLERLGVKPGERVFGLAGRVPQLHVAALGALKNRNVFCPLFSAFGPEPIQQRMALGDARVLVTTPVLYARKVAGLRERLPELRHVVLIGASGRDVAPDSIGFDELLASGDPGFEIRPTDPEDVALLHFTSGTTGRPKGVVHVHRAVLAHHVTARYALDLRADDVFWCTADPGWVTGTSYGIIAPLTHGATNLLDEGEFDGERWYRILQDERVSVWYTAPTAVRMLMRLGEDLPRRHDLACLRFAASVGEPLNPEAVLWSQRALPVPLHDNWWQTETGGIMIANFAATEIRPGSMGRPLPGIEAAIVRRAAGGDVESMPDGETGELALRRGWPSMFRGYLGEEERYRACFAGDWYLTGDLARRDADGYFWFVGRADDLIKSAGHLIGPFEVESCLMEHEAVAEAAVIGKPDPVAGDVVKAFVLLRRGRAGDEALRRDILAFARRRLGTAVAPREIEFTDRLPRTRSGKILRRLLRARELHLPEGDLSTLEGGA
jgi:acetyl-CoA synthetase